MPRQYTPRPSGRPGNLFFLRKAPAGAVKGAEVVECGCCGSWHLTDYDGDCRNDSERFDWDDRDVNMVSADGRVTLLDPTPISDDEDDE